MRERSCALVVVGNEILSGKVQDSNAYFAACELRKIGVALARIATIPDDLDLIAGEVAYCSRNFDFVITSGGVGPTHDDLTMEGVARAFNRRLPEPGILTAEFLCVLKEELSSESARLPVGELLWKLLENSPEIVNMPDDVFVANISRFKHPVGTAEPR